MTKETKIVIVLVAIWLYYHWASLRSSLATGLTGAAGNFTPGYSTQGGPASNGPGNYGYEFRETWGSEY